jgi:HisJ family histidinol phosphate phosphatase
MALRVDNHSHIILANINDMVGAAKAKGVTEYSITEHVSQFKELRESVKFGSTHTTGRLFQDLNEYEREFQKIELHDQGMKINRGLEVDFSPRFKSQIAEFVDRSKWDILLCSVHEFENAKDIEGNPGRGLDQDEVNNRWREYIRLQQLALESDFVPFQVLAHPVRMFRGLRAAPSEMGELLQSLAATATTTEKALELNGNDIDNAPKLVRLLASACSETGCKVSLGSDSHHPRGVFRNMDAAMQLVDEFKLRQFSIASTR